MQEQENLKLEKKKKKAPKWSTQ